MGQGFCNDLDQVMYSLIIGWVSGPFVKFLKAIPPKVWYAFLVVTTLAIFVTHEKGKSFKKGKQEGDEVVEEIKEQIVEHNEDVKETIQEAEEAIEQFEEKVGGSAADDLNLRELRKLTRNDPNNIEPSVRIKTD